MALNLYRGVQTQIPIGVDQDLPWVAEIHAIVNGTLASALVVADALTEHVDAIDEREKDYFKDAECQFLVEKQNDLGHVLWDNEQVMQVTVVKLNEQPETEDKNRGSFGLDFSGCPVPLLKSDELDVVFFSQPAQTEDVIERLEAGIVGQALAFTLVLFQCCECR